MKINLLFLLILFMVSCHENDEGVPVSENLLIGSWADPAYEDEKIIFKRAASLPDENYGVSFKANSDFIERSSGWCGTPPLVFSDYEGNWSLKDSIISITQQQYPNNYAWRIVSLTESKLIVKRELTEQEEDHQELMELYDEIHDLLSGVSCTDAGDWTFTAYGAKACGGPQGYIAYSNQMDTAAFLQKVEAYTEAEKAYNIKWGISSTCDLPSQPKGVACVNGFPVLQY